MPNLCGLTGAESNRSILKIIAEDPACFAQTPTVVGTVAREVRLTSSSIVSKKGTKTSSEIRADRMVPSIIEVSASADGSISFELSTFSFDDLFAAFLLSFWSRTMSGDSFKGSNVSFTAVDTVSISGGDYRPYFTVGRTVKTAGFQTAQNNNYWVILAKNFGSGVTTIQFTTATGVIEGGTATTKIQDANDVILTSTAIRSGTAGAGAFDSNGGNLFTAAVAAGHIVVGQTIHVSGLGFPTAPITFTGGLPVDTDLVTLFDGVDTVVFEFDTNSAYGRGRIPVAIGGTDDITATNLTNAINLAYAQKKIKMGASVDLTGIGAVITVTCFATTFATATIVEAATNITTAVFTGGQAITGFYTVTNAANDVISVTPTPPTNANAGLLKVTIKGSHVRNPGVISQITKQSFVIETGFTDVAQYFVRNGMRVGGFKLNVNAGEIVKGEFDFMGTRTTVYNADPFLNTPYVPLAATANEPLNATVNVGVVKKNGVELAVSIHKLEIDGSAGLRDQMAVGSKYPVGIGYGRMGVNGKMEVYFETLEMYNHFLNHDTISLSFTFTDTDGNSYVFTMPALKITSDPIAPGGIDTDIMEQLTFVTQRDPVLNTQFMIDRFSSIFPGTA